MYKAHAYLLVHISTLNVHISPLNIYFNTLSVHSTFWKGTAPASLVTFVHVKNLYIIIWKVENIYYECTLKRVSSTPEA